MDTRRPIFSFSNKTRVVLRDVAFWLALAALSIAAMATVLMVAHFSQATDENNVGRKRNTIRNPSRLRRFAQGTKGRRIINGVAGGIIVGFISLVLFAREAAIIIIIPVSLVGGILVVPKAAPPPERSAGTIIGLLSLVCSCLASILGLILAFTGTRLNPNEEIALMSLAVGAYSGLVAFRAFRPSSRQLPIVIAALLGMVALFVIAFIIGVSQDFNLVAAKFYAVALLSIAAATLAWHLTRSHRHIS